jgi:tape measure domain-containing protein
VANGVELATAYVSLVAETSKLRKQIDRELADIDARPAGKKIAADISRGLSSGNSEIARAGTNAAQAYERNLQSSIRGERVGTAIGTVIGKGIGAGIKVGIAGAAAAATGAVALLSTTLTKGFQRLQTIDQAKFKLQALGNSAADVQTIMDSATKSVKGTAFSLADAATASASAVAAGIKPGEKLTKYLSDVADSAAVAGTSFEEMGSIFNKIQTNNKAYTDDLQQLADRGLPIFTWLREEYGVSAEALQKMVEDGKVSASDFQNAIEQHIGGAAQKMGQSFGGAVDNMEAAMARLGANFLTAIFGGDSVNALAGPTEAVNKITEKFNQLDQWVAAHQGDIKNFFHEMADGAKWVVDKVKEITDLLIRYPELAKTAVIGFAAWKTIEGVSALLDSLKNISTMLGVTLPASASTGAAGISAALAKVAVPLWLAYLVGQGNPAIRPGMQLPNGSTTPNVQNGDRIVVGADGSVTTVPQSIPGGGGPNAQRQRRGADAVGPFDAGIPVTPDNVLNPPAFGSSAAPGGAAAAAPAGLTGNKGVAYQAMLQAGFPASEWGALQNLLNGESGFRHTAQNPSSTAYGMFQFLDSTWATVGGSKTSDPALQSQYGLQYIKQRYGTPSAAWAFWQSQSPHWYSAGGPAMGAGGPTADKIPAMLSNGEHVWTAAEVNAVGGQDKVYQLRQMALAGMIPGFNTGGAVDNGQNSDLMWMMYGRWGQKRDAPEPLQDMLVSGGRDRLTRNLDGGINAGIGYSRAIEPGNFNPNMKIDTSTSSFFDPSPGNNYAPDYWSLTQDDVKSITPLRPNESYDNPVKRARWDMKKNDAMWRFITGQPALPGYSDGGQVTLEDLLKQGVDPNTTQHGTGQGAPPGPTPDQLQQLGQALGAPQQDQGTQTDAPGRTQGYIPAAAGNTSTAGTSFLSGIYGMGAEVINGIIDQAANAASQAAGAAATVFAPGSGGAASGLTSAAISMGTQAAKRGVEYGAQMLGIGTDALIEQLTPFGAPRLLTTDVTGFMPQQAIMGAATTSIEKAFQQGNQPPGDGPQQHQGTGAPPGPVQPPPPGPFPAPTPPLPGPPAQPENPAPQPAATQPPDQPQWDPLQFLNGGVFDSGGWLKPGGVAVNLGNKPEPVLSPQQWESMASQPAAQSGNVTYQVYAQNLDEAMRSLRNKERLDMMQHAGRP